MRPILVHSMGRCGSGTIYETLKRAGYRTAHVHYLTRPPDDQNREALKLLQACKDVYVITPIRKPIARNLSAFFMNYVSYGKAKPTWEEFLSRYSHEVPLTWFDREMLPVWGIDVYREPFDTQRGWQIYDGKVLVIRLMNLNDEWENAFYALTGNQAPPMVFDNRQEDTRYARLRQVEKYFRDMHDNQYWNHFYGG